MIRDDLSNRLIHLTRGDDEQAAAILLNIIKERTLRGGTGKIEGGYRCVCFSEAPVSKIAGILANPSAHGMRYKPFGVMIEKAWLFERGGRPVIYQRRDEYDLLPDDLRYRHVTYEPDQIPPIDFSWEREWRTHTDELRLESMRTTLVVPNRAWEDYIDTRFREMHMGLDKWAARDLLVEGWSMRSAWHLIVLEDLGVTIPSVDPPPNQARPGPTVR